MINPALVHPSVKHMVKDADNYSLGEWRKITANWPPQAKEFAIQCRTWGEEVREKKLIAKKDETDSQALIAAVFGHDSLMSLAFLCLSDKQLDAIIASFKP
ncbi:MAG: hypothetical protein AAB449_00155 [Patescibacteria group bacterium]